MEPVRLETEQRRNDNRLGELLPPARRQGQRLAQHEPGKEHDREQCERRDQPGQEIDLPAGGRDPGDNQRCDDHEHNPHGEVTGPEQDDECPDHDDREQPVRCDPPSRTIEREDQRHDERADRRRVEDVPAANRENVLARHGDEGGQCDGQEVRAVEDRKEQHPENQARDDRGLRVRLDAQNECEQPVAGVRDDHGDREVRENAQRVVLPELPG